MLVDPSFLIDVLWDYYGAVLKAKKLAGRSVPMFVSAPTIFELYAGVGFGMKPSEESKKVLEILGSLAASPRLAICGKSRMIYSQNAKEGNAD